MLSLPPLVDNVNRTLEDAYKRIIPQIEEGRIATGYFYLSGFDLYREDLENLAEPNELGHAPLRILMGRQTNRGTADEIGEGQNLKEELKREVRESISELNNAQIGRLDRLRDFIAEGEVSIRVRNPENGYFHAKGASFRAPLEDDEDWGQDEDEDTRADRVRVVGPDIDEPALDVRPTGRRDVGADRLDVASDEQDSTIQLWSADGQARLANLRVGVVGCGGVGSILAEHLARLGVGELVFVDFDRLESANFNRAQGARRIDVRQERLKTEVAERVARRSATAEDFETRVVDGSVVDQKPEYAAVPDLLDCDLIMSGVDAARPRQILDALARAHCIPVIDGGSLLHANDQGVLEKEAKVETAVTGPGWPCFECQRVWTQDDVDWEADHPEFRGKRGYVEGGVDPDEKDRDPSVIGVNAIVAGLIQRRFLAITLDVAQKVVETLRLGLRNVETNMLSTWGCEEDCEAAAVGVGDREELPTGTDWAMRYEREDMEMPEQKIRDASDLVEDLR